jgi:hypothetical protein
VIARGEVDFTSRFVAEENQNTVELKIAVKLAKATDATCSLEELELRTVAAQDTKAQGYDE